MLLWSPMKILCHKTIIVICSNIIENTEMSKLFHCVVPNFHQKSLAHKNWCQGSLLTTVLCLLLPEGRITQVIKTSYTAVTLIKNCHILPNEIQLQAAPSKISPRVLHAFFSNLMHAHGHIINIQDESLRSFPVKNFIWMWVCFFMVMELWMFEVKK